MESVKYFHRDGLHNLTAPREIVPIIMELTRPSSVLDVGCGTGTWLKAFQERGVNDLLGIDGVVLDSHKLHIDPSNILQRNLAEKFQVGRKFDLVICLEVAEHIPKSSAETLVESLTEHGDQILFSAAIPGQGGQHHINEQWPEYWRDKFRNKGFFFHDVIRPKIWNNEQIDSWYRQNLFLANKEQVDDGPMLSLVHPVVFKAIQNNHREMLESLLSGRQGLKVSAKIFLESLLFKLRTLFGGRT